MPSFAKLSNWLLSPSFTKLCRRGSRTDSSDPLEAQLGRPSLATSTSTLSCLSTGSSSQESVGPKVSIDAVTEVPYELYLDLVAAGKSARARGQHRKVRPQGRGSGQAAREPSRRKTRLVSCEAGPLEAAAPQQGPPAGGGRAAAGRARARAGEKAAHL